MLEIVILQRFSVIVIFILTASLLQIHTDLLNFGSAARHYSLDYFYYIIFSADEQVFLLFLVYFFPSITNLSILNAACFFASFFDDDLEVKDFSYSLLLHVQLQIGLPSLSCISSKT